MRNWHADSAIRYVYAPNERFEVRLCERAITPAAAARQYVVHLYRDDCLREAITTEPTKAAAHKHLRQWLADYPVIITG